MRLKYLLSPNSDLTVSFIGKRIQDFQTRHLPKLNQLWNYYVGKQKITKKQATDTGKPNNIAMVNYCNSIVNNYNGYLTGLPISYENDDFKEVVDIINYNDPTQEDNEYLKQALIFGRAFEVNYIDEDGKQRFKLFNTRECLPIYSNTLNGELLYVVRFYQEALLENQIGMDNYIVEVYGPNNIQRYRSAPGFASFELIEEIPHYFNQCPVTVFSLNEDEESIFAQIITLQDSYNTLLSAGIDDYDAWADAYLILKGVTADAEDLAAMKEHRVLMVDNDADAQYLTKNTNDDELSFLLDTINKQIFRISNAPDLNNEKFYSQTGIALKMKLVGFETKASNIENQMRKALQRRIELICSILHLTAEGEEQWRDVKITFKRNLPVDLSDEADVVNKLRGLVSDETLLGQLSFIRNPKEELERVREQQKAEMSDIEFGHNIEDYEEQANTVDRQILG